MNNVVRRAPPRPLISLLATLAGLWLAVLPAGATIDAALQMQLGNPSGALPDPADHHHYLIQRPVEALDYSDTLGEANWVSWDLTAGDIGSSGRGAFAADPDLPLGFYAVSTGDYSGSGYDRGHMCPSGDRTVSAADNDLVFYMSNIIPQAADNNQGVWAGFETYCRSLAQTGSELLITCGPGGFDGARIASGKAAIPTFTWKIAVVVPPGTGPALSRITAATRVIALKIPNSNGVSSAWQKFVTSASQIQQDTGLAFFTALPVSLAATLRSQVDGVSDPPPAIAGFSPASGTPNTLVVITGTNLSAAQTVTFNGWSAVFTVDSPTQITATVPTNANSGPLSVSTPTGLATSANNFTVSGVVVPDLALTLTHAGHFTQGDPAAFYSIIVTNLGNAASAGTVTVRNALPAGLTPTALAGSGWTVDLAALTCARADALAARMGYPPITLTVSVASNAPASLTNLVSVSGGGDTNLANNTASDPTPIQALGAGGFTGTLVAWDVSGQAGFGLSPLAPTTQDTNLTVGSLTRGAGLTTSGTPAARAWGANNFVGATPAAAVGASQFVTFTVTAKAGFSVSYASIGRFDYRRSGTGPVNGVLQYQVGSGPFTEIATVTYSNSSSSGASLGPMDLAGIAPLQNVPSGANVTFRIVNWGATGPSGTWYLFDVAASPASDFSVQGTVTPTSNVALTPIQAWRLYWFGTTADLGLAADTNRVTGDGMANLLKYALGLNPLVPTNSPVLGDIDAGHLRLTWPRNPGATDVTFSVELASDFSVPWTTNGTTVDLSDSSVVRARDDTPVSGAASRLMRLRVSRP